MFDNFFFFNDTATTEIYTLSLHDALPISKRNHPRQQILGLPVRHLRAQGGQIGLPRAFRSEEHTSELQSPCNLVCRLLLEKKKKSSSVPAITIHASRVSAISWPVAPP